jgi:hypothetical protein
LYAKYGKVKKVHAEDPKDKSKPQATNAPTSSCQSTSQKTLLSFCHLKTNRDSSQPTNQGINSNFKEVTAVTKPSRDSSESSDQGFQGINSSSEDVTKTNRSIR